MTALVAILWAIYLSECVVRVRTGEWVFRRGLSGGVRGVGDADAQFLDGRLELSWTALLPWSAAYVVSGSALDPSGVKTRLLQATASRRLVAVFASTLFVLILIVFPALIFTNSVAPALPYLLVGVIAAWIGTFATFVSAYRQLNGARPVVEIWLTQALSPLSLCRAPFVLTLRTVADAHPVAAAAVLCGDEEFLRIARAWHYDDPASRKGIERLASDRGLRQALTAAPSRLEDGTTLFCPRCHATYLPPRAECRDCVDVALTPLS